MHSLRKWLLGLLAVMVILSGAAWYTRPDNLVHVYFLDVGQGDATLIQQGNRYILIDGGPSPQAIDNALGKILPFWDRSIDLLVMTHPHSDHLAGLVEVLTRYKVGEVLYPALATSDTSDYDQPLWDEWLSLIAQKNIKATLAQAGQVLSVGDIELDVLNPPATELSGTQSDADNNSVVLDVKTGAVSFLLTGDLMWEGEEQLEYTRMLTQCTVLKVGHHGSDTSTTDAFLDVVMPQIAVIEVGQNDYGLPTSTVLDRLAGRLGANNVYRTDQDGTVEFTTDGTRLWIKTSPPSMDALTSTSTPAPASSP